VRDRFRAFLPRILAGELYARLPFTGAIIDQNPLDLPEEISTAVGYTDHRVKIDEFGESRCDNRKAGSKIFI